MSVTKRVDVTTVRPEKERELQNVDIRGREEEVLNETCEHV